MVIPIKKTFTTNEPLKLPLKILFDREKKSFLTGRYAIFAQKSNSNAYKSLK